MSAPLRPGLLAVARREVAWIRRDRVARLMVLVVPLIAFALLAMTFSNAVIRQLKVDVVDQDRSPSSLSLVQAIDAAPGVTVALRSADLTGAMHAIRSGEAIAATYIPQDFERDLMAGRRPQVVIFYNKQFFTPGQCRLRGAAGRHLGGDRRPAERRRRPPAPRRARWSSSNMC